jgi:AcrR family transcriptional regulator
MDLRLKARRVVIRSRLGIGATASRACNNQSKERGGTAQPMSKMNPHTKRNNSTRERLLEAAGALLREVGMERISTNMICQRAGVTPPALYHYFSDKYDIVAALGERLMQSQNDALVAWIELYADSDIEDYIENIGQLLHVTAAITEAEPGGVWLERALHSTPRLDHVRIQSHQFVTEKLAEALHLKVPSRSFESVSRRVRFIVEIGYAAVEMVHSETNLSREDTLNEAARIIGLALIDLRE